MQEREKQNIRREIEILEKMIQDNEKDEKIQEQRKKLDKKLKEYTKDL